MDILDEVEKKQPIEFKVMPPLVRIRKELSKTEKSYFSFLSQEGWVNFRIT